MTSDRDDRRFPDPEELDAQIDDVIAGRLDAEAEGDPDEVTETLQHVRALADEPLPEASRTRALQRIRTHQPADRRRAPVAGGHRGHRQVRRGGARRRLVSVTAGALALMMLTAGTAVAVAQDAAPDDALYGVKRASEQAWLVMPRGQERAADVHLALAERRIEEARRAPQHAERLVAEGVENVEAAADERPEEAIENFKRLLGLTEGEALPENASDAARAALHRNCVRIADRHELGSGQCGDAPDFQHPGRGLGQDGEHPGRGLGQDGEHPGRGLGQDGEHPGRGEGRGLGDGEGRPENPGRGLGPSGSDGPRGWGEGGRPEGVIGPPPGTPGYERYQERGGDEPSSEE